MAAKKPAKKTRTKRGGSPTPELTEDREQKAWAMRCANHTQPEIAQALGVNVSTVCRALQRIRKREYVEFAKTREQHKIDQTRQLEHNASQAMRSWEKSLQPLQSVRQTTDADGNEVTVTTATEREGNVAYLYVVLKCMADIRDIWGFDVLPAAQDVGSSLAEQVQRLDERAKRYEAEVKAATAGGTPPAAPQGAGEVPA